MTMNIITDSAALRQWVRNTRGQGRRIALVPTMGNLHEGHRSLIRIARQEADETVVSLFVNPTQFGPGEDYERYPRTPDADADSCRAEQTDVLFSPDAAAMYAAGHSTYVTEETLSAGWCGTARPGHFRGVCTIVAKLFHLVQPDVAVFGEKDFQQLRVIERMTRDLAFPTRILPGPIVRESDGLALSSRNRYLSGEERRQAASLYAGLQEAQRLRAQGECDAARLCAQVAAVVARSPNAQIEYLALVDDLTLLPVTVLEKPARMLLAVSLGATRLIDNLRLE